MDALTALKTRVSADHFDPSRLLSEAEIRELVAYATEAPSSFNIQHWRFVAVTDPKDKERLKALAYNQQKVADAAVVFIVLGDLKGYEKLPEIVQRAVAAGILPPERAESWVNMAQATYANNPTLARDEAIRSGALAAMALMIAAQAKGLVSGPMIGFDPEGVKREFAIADRYVPVMLLAVGYPAAGNLPRKPRLGVEEVLAFGRGREF
ncbi:nitroreductase family protein [Synechococcus sp. H65.1]|uniref:nitroreductase family protein n=1 Tax=unclassified Synechococcus TaxID=2626047 RepID=UPI0039C410C6